jgi:thiosulfate dehydrogenase (quinone) large subunit
MATVATSMNRSMERQQAGLLARLSEGNALQRTIGALRFASFWLWLEGTLWKSPFHPDGPYGCGPGMVERIGQAARPTPPLSGLCDWINEEIFFTWLPANKWFVQNIVVPNFAFFGFGVWLTELLIAISFFTGAFTRLGALLAIGLSVHLFIGLGFSPREWYWSYLLMIMINLVFLVGAAGRSFGLDALIAPKLEALSRRGGIYTPLRWLA